MDVPHLPDWDERILELGNPELMDPPTLIEWIQRQLESEEDTKARHAEMSRLHRAWHRSGGGAGLILACCIRTGVMTPNEVRSMMP
jgi:hypothetical protein